jgi:hypothetical protein
LITVDGIPTIFPIGEGPVQTASVRAIYNYSVNTSPTPKQITVNFEGCPVGDLMVVAFGTTFTNSPSSIQMTEPSGWDRLYYGANGPQVIARRRMEGDSNTFVFSYNHTSAPAVTALSIRDLDYTNGTTSSLVIGDPSAENNTTPKTIPAIALDKERLCIAFHSTASTNTESVSFNEGWILESFERGISGNTRSISVAYKVASTTSGDAIVTMSPTANTNRGVIIGF